MCLAPEGQGKWILYICMLVPWGWAKRAAIFFKEIRPMETKPRWKFVLVEMKPIYLRLRDKPYFGGNGAENPCLSVSKKKKLSRYWWKFCKCWKIRKKLCFYFCQTRTQEQSFPVLQWIAKIKNPPSPPQCKYNCPSLLSTIVFIHLKLHKKKFQPKSMQQVYFKFPNKSRQ